MSQKKNKGLTLDWDAFRSMGNPENAPEIEEETTEEQINVSQQKVRIHLEKKGRGGKAVSIIRGLEGSDEHLKEMAKAIKQLCGVGGSYKDGEIIIQGERRDKIIDYLIKQGYKDVKKVGG